MGKVAPVHRQQEELDTLGSRVVCPATTRRGAARSTPAPISNALSRLVEQLDLLLAASGWTEAQKLQVHEKHGGMDHDSAWAFFHEPIFVQRTMLGNGQHRVCAMKTVSVPRCLINPESSQDA